MYSELYEEVRRKRRWFTVDQAVSKLQRHRPDHGQNLHTLLTSPPCGPNRTSPHPSCDPNRTQVFTVCSV
uniref:Uncharacterized protein n=1 Tax=Knipowitschia caucasica TaxID=637954 RepID=A0AAV2L038_KNICA